MRDEKTNEDLVCYASGNGSLSFCWVRGGNATGRKVTVADAKGYLETDRVLREKNYRVCCVDGVHPIVVAPVKRVSAQCLELDGRQYNYTINKGDLFYQRDNEVREVSLYLYAVEDAYQVRNLNTISAIVFFLNHEKTLTEQMAGL
jgi:hypothetical protein